MNLPAMITKPKKHRTRVPGVTVTLSPCGSFTVTATAAAVKRWPWDGTCWPCADLRNRHRFTFESSGDLVGISTPQRDTEDGENGRAAGALADDCRTLAEEVKTRLETSPPVATYAEILTALDLGIERLEDDFYDTQAETWIEHGARYAHERFLWAFRELEKKTAKKKGGAK